VDLLQVMVEIGGGFKMGTVKFIGETEFAAGEWIGVALDKPNGELWVWLVRCLRGWSLLCVYRETQWLGEGNEIFQMQRQTWSVCAERQDRAPTQCVPEFPDLQTPKSPHQAAQSDL